MLFFVVAMCAMTCAFADDIATETTAQTTTHQMPAINTLERIIAEHPDPLALPAFLNFLGGDAWSSGQSFESLISQELIKRQFSLDTRGVGRLLDAFLEMPESLAFKALRVAYDQTLTLEDVSGITFASPNPSRRGSESNEDNTGERAYAAHLLKKS